MLSDYSSFTCIFLLTSIINTDVKPSLHVKCVVNRTALLWRGQFPAWLSPNCVLKPKPKLPDLVFHVMLHVHVGTAQDFKAERTEEVFSVFMDGAEMVLYIWEERRSVVADLWAEMRRWDKQDMTGNVHMLNMKRSEVPDSHTASLLVCDCPSCVPTALVLSQRPIHKSYN